MSSHAVGDLIESEEQIDDLPPGTVICITRNERATYTKRDDQTWTPSDGTLIRTTSDFSLNGYNRILSLPDGYTPTPEEYESPRCYAWRFADTVMVEAEQRGYQNLVTDTLAGVGFPLDEYDLGPGVRVSSRWAQERLAAGSAVTCGHPGARNFSMHVKNEAGNWTRVLGANNSIGDVTPVAVHSCPGTDGPPSWLTETGDEAALLKVKARLWRLGWRLKQSHDWCSDYEYIVARAGLTPDVAQQAAQVRNFGTDVGDWVNEVDCASLPMGTVLMWQPAEGAADPDDRVWFIRDNAANNVARTRRLFGWRASAPLRNSMSVMQIVGDSEEGVESIQITGTEMGERLFQAVPPGTWLTVGSSWYTIAEDHLAYNAQTRTIPSVGHYTAEQFGTTATWTVRRLP